MRSPLITEENGSKIVSVADDPADRLVDGSERLLPVPLLPREVLRGHTHTLAAVTHWVAREPPSVRHSYFNSRCFLEAALVQKLHLQNDPRVQFGWEWKSGDDDASAQAVGEVQTFTHLTGRQEVARECL